MARLSAESRIRNHHAARDRGEKRGHNGQQFGSSHFREVDTDCGYGLNSKEDKQADAKRFGSGRLQCTPHAPGQGANDGLDDPEVVQDRRNRRDSDILTARATFLALPRSMK